VLEHRPHDALRHLRSVVGALSERGDARQLIQALRVYADAERDLQHDGAAAAALRGAAAFVEAVPISALDGDKRAAFVATQHEVYSEWTDLLASAALKDPTQTWAAFEVSERGRARSLRLALAQSPDSTSNRGPADGEAAYHELIAGVGQRARASGYAARWPEALLAQIESARAGSNDREPGAGVTLPAALSDLDATLVEYAVGNERLFAFVADARSIRVFPLGPLGPVREGAAALLKALREPEGTERTIGPAARRLAELIWWPIEPALTRPKIVLVPDDTLYTVPFAVLPWSARAASELTLARAELTSLGSASLLPAVSRLAMGSARHAQRGRFELFGDPVTSPDDWERRCGGAAAARAGHGASAAAALPGSRREVITVSTLARQANPSRPIDVHLSCEATHSVLDRAIGRDPALLHIATHGAVDGARPRLSALMMSQTRAPENSDFSVVDILRHRITTRLVVLSACETSAGQMLPGEGLLGPAQAFLHAGASSVIGSAWKVPDEHTAEFMARFYELLLTKGLRASAALRAAQLEERTRTQSYAWAAFGIFGSPEVRFEPE
jgi:CHAT domain-containing protein